MSRRRKRRRDDNPGETEPRGAAWLRDDVAVKKWIACYDLPASLQRHGGLVMLRDFLPEHVAEAMRQEMEALPPSAWEKAESDDTYDDDIKHSFTLSEVEERDDAILGVARLLWRMMPHYVPNFTAARYSRRDHIAPHNDQVLERYTWKEYREVMRAYSEERPALVRQDFERGGRATIFERRVAAVFYLNKGWKRCYGGELLDLETGKKYLPAFNSLVVFSVPRMHQVSAVRAPPGRARFSLFGWWLEKGHKSAGQEREEEVDEGDKEEVEVMSLEEARAIGI